jgi:hypothetical protein
VDSEAGVLDGAAGWVPEVCPAAGSFRCSTTGGVASVAGWLDGTAGPWLPCGSDFWVWAETGGVQTSMIAAVAPITAFKIAFMGRTPVGRSSSSPGFTYGEHEA